MFSSLLYLIVCSCVLSRGATGCAQFTVLSLARFFCIVTFWCLVHCLLLWEVFYRRPRPKYVTLCMATLHIACSNSDTEAGPDSRQVPINLNNCLCAFFSEQFYIENISLVHVS